MQVKKYFFNIIDQMYSEKNKNKNLKTKSIDFF